MNIAELWGKGKYWASYGRSARQALELLILVSVALGAFACGRISVLEERDVPVAIIRLAGEAYDVSGAASSSMKTIAAGEEAQGRGGPAAPGAVVASKNSSKYHLPWCSGARTIKEENKIWFASEADAQASGYTRAANCR